MAEVFEEVRRLYVSFSLATSSCIEPEGPGVGVEPSVSARRVHTRHQRSTLLSFFFPPRTHHGALTQMLNDESAITDIRGCWLSDMAMITTTYLYPRRSLERIDPL